MTYRRLVEHERYHIYRRLQNQIPIRIIAEELDRSISTIRREISRNQLDDGYYSPPIAMIKARKRQEHKTRIRITKGQWVLIESLIKKEQLSPDQISGWLKLHFGFRVSHEWIYQHIYKNQSRDPLLALNLRHYKKSRYKNRYKKQVIENKRNIGTRPDVIENRSRISNWEIDTMIGTGHQGIMLVAVERKSKLVLTCLLKSKTEQETTPAILKLLKPYKNTIKSITSDNGGEFAGHETIAAQLDIDYYFANPYSSWERGTVENSNGLLRQYYPKNTNFLKTDPNNLILQTQKLNRRPRKTLGYQTPQYTYHQSALAS